VNDKAPRDRNLSMVFQNYALYPHLTVYENIAFPLRLAKMDDGEVKKRVTEAADVLELHEHLERKPANLSGGQRQRVAMGRAIVRQAEAFLFDEPLSNLDAKLRGQMRTEISRLQRRLGITTVYVTHDQTEAMTLGDRVAVMRKGILQQVASPRELYEQPVNLFVAGFIGSPPMNFLPATVRGDHLETPFGPVKLDERKARPWPARTWCSLGVRPEYFEDASLVEESKFGHGSTFTAKVDVTEWLGDSQYAYIPFDAPEEVTNQLRGPVEGAGQRPAAHAGHRLDRRDQPHPRGPGGGVLDRHPQGALLRPGQRRQPHPGRRGGVRS
jgi:multiple sugar transport system ATP-binding protein